MARWGLYGPKRIVQAQFDEIRDILSAKAPTGTLTGELFAGENGSLLDAHDVPMQHGALWVGIPILESINLTKWTVPRDREAKTAHGDYAPIIPNSGKMVLEWFQACKPIHEAHGIELMGDFFMHDRHIVLMNMFSWDQKDPDAKKRMDRLFLALHEAAKEKGYGMYRAHVQHMGVSTCCP